MRMRCCRARGRAPARGRRWARGARRRPPARCAAWRPRRQAGRARATARAGDGRRKGAGCALEIASGVVAAACHGPAEPWFMGKAFQLVHCRQPLEAGLRVLFARGQQKHARHDCAGRASKRRHMVPGAEWRAPCS